MNICLPLYSLMTESLPYRNQSIDLFYKPMDWFLYDRDLRHERLDDLKLVISDQRRQTKLFLFQFSSGNAGTY